MKNLIFSISALLFLVSVSCEKKTNCANFRTGNYLISKDSLFKNPSKLVKTEHTQYQVSSQGDTLFAKVKWLNDCSYRLTFDKSKMTLSPFHINVNNREGFLVEFGIPSGDIMPYVSVLKGETKTEVFRGYLKKVN